MKTGIKVLEAMTNKPITADQNISLQACAKKMKEYDVGSLLITEDKKIIGIITEQDLVFKVLATALNVKKPVKDVMETKLVTVSPEKDIFETLELMKKNDIRQVPVKDKNEIIGLITLKDILKIEPQLFDLVVEALEIREESRKPIFEAVANEGICELCGKYSKKIKVIDGSKVCPECISSL